MDKNDNLTFSISQVAEMLGVVPGTIRNWEKSGLIAAKRSDSNYRVFTVDDIAKLRKIREYSIDKHMGAHAINSGIRTDSSRVEASWKRASIKVGKSIIQKSSLVKSGGRSAKCRGTHWRKSAVKWESLLLI